MSTGIRSGQAALALASITWLAACFSDTAKNPVGAVSAFFPTDVVGLDYAKPSAPLPAGQGETIEIVAMPVKKSLRGKDVRMLGYNGSIPGPLIRVKQGTEILLKLKNLTGFPTTLHAHGIRMDYQFDGAANFSQQPVAQGDSFTYRLKFPDAGLFWYHAHAREDWSQEMGLYGNILVEDADSLEMRPANREQPLVLDDFFLDTATGSAPFKTKEADHTMMGRFGNLYLINGDTAFDLTVKRNEVVRFFATNAANARAFNVGFTGADGKYGKVKLLGGDNGYYQYFDREENVLLAPGERRVFDAWFDRPGTMLLVHHILKGTFNSESTVILGRVTVLSDSAEISYAQAFQADDSSLATLRSMDSLKAWLDPKTPPDKELLFTTGEMDHSVHAMKAAASQGEPISTEAKGVEWLDHMPGNAQSTASTLNWVIKDIATSEINHQIRWNFRKDDKVRIRIRNDSASMHWMPHPIHFHGQRFVVVAVNGIPNLNKSWKDTYLVGMRETTDILLDASNPGSWMAHCHIAEHAEANMMFHFRVD